MSAMRRWAMIVVALISTAIVWGIILPSFSLWSPQWIKAFGASHGEIMAANTLNQIGMGLIAPIAGYAVGAVSVRALMLLGAGATAAALVLIAHATAMWQVTLLHTIALSAGLVLCGPVVTQVLAVRLFVQNSGLALGIVSSGAALCGFTMPPLIGALLEHFEWRVVDLQLAGLVLLLMPLIFLVVRQPRVENGQPQPVDPPSLSVGDLFRSRIFWGLLLFILPLHLLFNAIFYNLGFSIADMGGGAGETATILTLTGLVALPGILVFGFLADRVAHWPLLLAAGAVIALCCALIAFARSYGVMLFAVPVMGFAVGGLIPLIAAVLADHFAAANFARANGLITPFITLATLGSALAGFGRDYLGSYQAVDAVLLMGLPVCALGLLVLRFPAPAKAIAV
jgi:MFS family permease